LKFAMSKKGEYNVIVEMEDQVGSEAIVNDDDLQFQDFSSSSRNLNAGKITVGQQPATFSATPDFQDPYRAIQTEAAGSTGFWTVEYYARYFNIDTPQVLDRMLKAVYPLRPGAETFLETISPNPDMYGPFWLATTVILLLFVGSSLAGSVSAHLSGNPYTYDFAILSFAVFVVYIYVFVCPVLVWGALKYFGCQPSLVELWGVYGYGLVVWIPVSLLCVIPINILRWVFVGLGFGISGYHLFTNLYPIISRADAKTSRAVLIVVLVGHAIIALIFKFQFFDQTLAGKAGTGGDAGTGGS